MDSNKLKVLDLFAGIAGFSKGLHRAGFKTVAFCEQDDFCQKVLSKNFPGIPIFADIKTLTKEKLNAAGIYSVDVVCGGFPCQPFSNAGKKKGRQDDRDLWPEMFRVIKETKPTWVIGENVAGFVSMEFTRTKVDLEGFGYRVQPFIIPACAVGAQHGRNRVWIIAHLDRKRVEGFGSPIRDGEKHPISSCESVQESVANINSNGLCGKTNATKKKNTKRNWENNWWSKAASDFGYWWADQSGVGRAVYGFSTTVDRYRRPRVKALGNSVVPQIPEIIGRYILEVENVHM